MLDNVHFVHAWRWEPPNVTLLPETIHNLLGSREPRGRIFSVDSSDTIRLSIVLLVALEGLITNYVEFFSYVMMRCWIWLGQRASFIPHFTTHSPKFTRSSILFYKLRHCMSVLKGNKLRTLKHSRTWPINKTSFLQPSI